MFDNWPCNCKLMPGTVWFPILKLKAVSFSHFFFITGNLEMCRFYMPSSRNEKQLGNSVYRYFTHLFCFSLLFRRDWRNSILCSTWFFLTLKQDSMSILLVSLFPVSWLGQGVFAFLRMVFYVLITVTQRLGNYTRILFEVNRWI